MTDLNSLRQIHMDFHTPGFVSVGDRFDAKEFFDILEESRVNSIAFFAKCHHGYSYAYLNTGYHVHRTVMHNLINNALQDKIIETNAPSIVEITVGYKDNRTILQCVAFAADRRRRYSFESLNEPIPIRNINIRLRTEKRINRLYNPISGQELDFVSGANDISFIIPEVIDHLLLVGE